MTQNIRCSFKLVTVPQIYSILCFTHSFGLLVTAACPPLPQLIMAREIWASLLSCQT